MSELRPEIKRLLTQARGRAERRDETVPFGFAARVVAKARVGVRPAPLSLQRAFSAIMWISALVIVSCVVVLLQHRRADDPAIEMVATTQHFAEALSP